MKSFQKHEERLNFTFGSLFSVAFKGFYSGWRKFPLLQISGEVLTKNGRAGITSKE